MNPKDFFEIATNGRKKKVKEESSSEEEENILMRAPIILARKTEVGTIKEKVKFIKLLGKRVTRPDESGNLVKDLDDTAQKKPRKALPIADYDSASDSREEEEDKEVKEVKEEVIN